MLFFTYQQLHITLRSRSVKIERFPSPLVRSAFAALHEERLARALAAAKATVRASVMAEAAVAAANAADADRRPLSNVLLGQRHGLAAQGGTTATSSTE
jgi:hypothetical protein